MVTKTKLINPTNEKQRYNFVPKHGVTVQAKSELIIDGDIYTLAKRAHKGAIQQKIDEGKLQVILMTDVQMEEWKPENIVVSAAEVAGAIQELDAPTTVAPEEEEEAPEGAVNTAGTETPVEGIADANVPFEDQKPLGMGGEDLDIVGEDEFMTIDGETHTEDSAVDGMELLKAEAEEADTDVAVVDGTATEEVEISNPYTKTALKSMSADEVKEIASSMNIKGDTKKVLIDKIYNAQ